MVSNSLTPINNPVGSDPEQLYLISTTLHVLTLTCNYNGRNIRLEIPSSVSLNELYLKLIRENGLPSDENHSFKVFSLETPEVIHYKDVMSPQHYNGYIALLGFGVYIEYLHPHRTVGRNELIMQEDEFNQIRDESLWPVGLVLSRIGPNQALVYESNGTECEFSLLEAMAVYDDEGNDIKYIDLPPNSESNMTWLEYSTISLEQNNRFQPESPNARAHLYIPDYSINSSTVGPLGIWISEAEIEARFVSLGGRIRRERTRFVRTQVEDPELTSDNDSDCGWSEPGGEKCVYCTEGFF